MPSLLHARNSTKQEYVISVYYINMKYAVLCPSINDVCTNTSNSEPYLLNTNLIHICLRQWENNAEKNIDETILFQIHSYIILVSEVIYIHATL